MTIKKHIILSMIIFISISIVLLAVITNQTETNINIVEVNDISQSLVKEWDSLDPNNLPGLNYGLDYVVLDKDNQVLAATRNDLNTDLNAAISNRDTIIAITSDDGLLGKLIIHNNSEQLFTDYKYTVLIISLSTILLVMLTSLINTTYLNNVILKPFRKLQIFARQVALGNLDLPLEMDKGNLFGAFSESFDLMRDELNKARENERLANQSKKELVASLSHDIKTPIASIKAVSEIMHAKTQDTYQKRQLDVINAKADQINTLITNMFSATLEELTELKVELTEEPSEIITKLIEKSDYNHQVSMTCNCECMVLMDVLRLSQVIDNVISNSYKYANTPIDVLIDISGTYLEVTFKDYGNGVPTDDVPLLFHKFYRGKNGEGKSGAGLGLYISNYLMQKMSGDIECGNTHDGFVVKMKLLII